MLGDVVVGERAYDHDGVLVIETPLRDGKKHGVELHWHDYGGLQSAEPYRNGLRHGTARQWDEDGTLLGTYTMRRGTGLDLWWCRPIADEPAHLSEAVGWKDGLLHGFEWWLNDDGSLWWERHWCKGQLHGIERDWNPSTGRLSRGYPRYHVNGEQVDRRKYIRACQHDTVLPPFRVVDNKPTRRFPAEVVKAIRRHR